MMKQTFCNRIGWAALALAFPISAADLTDTNTLNSGQTLNLDSGAASPDDIQYTGASLTFAHS